MASRRNEPRSLIKSMGKTTRTLVTRSAVVSAGLISRRRYSIPACQQGSSRARKPTPPKEYPTKHHAPPSHYSQSPRARAFSSTFTQLQQDGHQTPSPSDLHETLTHRTLPILYDQLTTTPSHLLNTALSSHLPAWAIPSLPDPQDPPHPHIYPPVPRSSENARMPPSHHILYFPPPLSPHQLLPDGTDPLHSPDPKLYPRRMWAGGTVRFNLYSPLHLESQRAACFERIRDVRVKGDAESGNEKMFVSIERRVAGLEDIEDGLDDGEEQLRRMAWYRYKGEEKDEDGFGGFYDGTLGAEVIERRDLVFMREKSQGAVIGGGSGNSMVQQALQAAKSTFKSEYPPKEPSSTPLKSVEQDGAGRDGEARRLNTIEESRKITQPLAFDHELTPDATLLFRYSALTYNAHRIHLDKSYCREVEGHKDLLVHGPLGFSILTVLLDGVLKRDARDAGGGNQQTGKAAHSEASYNEASNGEKPEYAKGPDTAPRERIETISYKNIVPLYCNEPVHFRAQRLEHCGIPVGHDKPRAQGRFRIWAENARGEVAVRGTAWTSWVGIVKCTGEEWRWA